MSYTIQDIAQNGAAMLGPAYLLRSASRLYAYATTDKDRLASIKRLGGMDFRKMAGIEAAIGGALTSFAYSSGQYDEFYAFIARSLTTPINQLPIVNVTSMALFGLGFGLIFKGIKRGYRLTTDEKIVNILQTNKNVISDIQEEKQEASSANSVTFSKIMEQSSTSSKKAVVLEDKVDDHKPIPVSSKNEKDHLVESQEKKSNMNDLKTEQASDVKLISEIQQAARSNVIYGTVLLICSLFVKTFN